MADVAHLVPAYGTKSTPRRDDRALAKLATAQHGVVAARQLRLLGYSSSAIGRRAESGRLLRIHRGVYAVGHARLSLRGRWMAAVLAAGPGALLSHRAAAALWELRPPPSGAIDVVVPGRRRRRARGIRCHSARTIDDADRASVDGIPVTAIERTMLDYAEVASAQRLRFAFETAERLERVDGSKLDALRARSRGRHGLKPLAAALDALRGPAPWTQSELELRFLELVRAASLPEPQTNVVIAGVTVDFYWPAGGLVVEVDGFRFHRTRASFESDRRRDARLQIVGCRVIRVTQERIERGRRSLVGDLRALLSVSTGSARAGR